MIGVFCVPKNVEVGNLEQVFPFLGVRVISINDGYDCNAYIGQTGGIDCQAYFSDGD